MKKERNTDQKGILIKYLQKKSNKHLTIQEIQNDLKDKIGMTTIYRIINDLIKKGIVVKIPFENKQGYCYKYNLEIEGCNNEHYHLICEKCNKLLHFESKKIPKIEKELNEVAEFKINNNRIVFYGICKECRNK